MSGRLATVLLAAVLLAAATQVPATTVPAAGQHVSASGAADGEAPGWLVSFDAPAGWTADCCTYARAIGVNFVLYQGDWTGAPSRVMVLNVWPRKLPKLDAELQADRTHYLARDPAAKAGSFPIRHRTMQCAANVFEGTDHTDDVVVFCDPGRASGIRLSWSLSFADNDVTRRALLDAFMRVVVATRYVRHEQTATSPASNSPTSSFPRLSTAAGLVKRESILPLATSTMDYRPLLRSALRAIGFADVRSGFLPSLSRFRGNDEQSSFSDPGVQPPVSIQTVTSN